MTDLHSRIQDMIARGDLHEAVGLLEGLAAATPADAKTWSDLGWAHYDVDRHGDAVMCLQRALALDPARHEAWICLGMIETDPTRALSCFEAALAIDGGDGGAWFLKSLALTDLGRASEAAECLARAKALDPALFGDP